MEWNLATVSFLVAGGAFLVILAAALRRRVLLRIGVRNVIRRKTQVALAVAGLTVATSIISGALVIDDSFDATVNAIVLRGTDHIDEILALEDEAGRRTYFDQAVYEDLAANGSALPSVDALAPRIHLPASVKDNRTGLVQPSLTVIGFDPTRDLGAFLLEDGTEVDGSALADDEVYLNAALAEELDAEPGDALQLFVNGATLHGQVRDVVQDRGRGGWNTAPNAFLRLDALQEGLGIGDRINVIAISNVGGVEDGHEATDDALRELEAVLGPDHPYTLEAVKRERIDTFTDLLDQLSQLFALISTFTIIAGVLLILNIFSMVAEERKTEMGMARALGMRRGHLVQAFIYEGFLYALASAALGAFAGLGLATVIMEAFRRVFTFFAQDLVVVYSLESLMTAFALGLLLTLATIAVASWRISKLNIVRAIKDLPEPPTTRASRWELLAAALLLGGGAVALYYGFTAPSEAAYIVGAPVAGLGAAILGARRLGPRLPLSAAGLLAIGWVLNPYRLLEGVEPSIENFILAGVLLVMGGVLLVMANSEFLLKLGPRLTRKRRNLPVIKAAIAYPMAKKFRTGVILAMFALIMFTITVMSLVMALTGSTVAVFARTESGGYDAIAFANPLAVSGNLEDRLVDEGFGDRIAYHDGLLQSQVEVSSASLDPVGYSLVGVTPGFVERTNHTFFERASGYDSDAAVWRALLDDSSLAVVDRGAQDVDFGPVTPFRAAVGDRLTLRNPLGGEAEVTVIGILDARFVPGVFLSADRVESFTGVSNPSLFYFKAAEGGDVPALSRDLEAAFVDLGLSVVNIRQEVEEQMEVTLHVMQLIQAFLALGLAVGISGLGVLAVRNVVERRPVIGTLRALGFRKDMILRAFLLELSFVAVLGILLGLVLGIALSYNLFLTMDIFAEAEFVIPVADLALILVLAFLASVLATLSPSRRASKLPPAEALRQVL